MLQGLQKNLISTISRQTDWDHLSVLLPVVLVVWSAYQLHSVLLHWWDPLPALSSYIPPLLPYLFLCRYNNSPDKNKRRPPDSCIYLSPVLTGQTGPVSHMLQLPVPANWNCHPAPVYFWHTRDIRKFQLGYLDSYTPQKILSAVL